MHYLMTSLVFIFASLVLFQNCAPSSSSNSKGSNPQAIDDGDSQFPEDESPSDGIPRSTEEVKAALLGYFSVSQSEGNPFASLAIERGGAITFVPFEGNCYWTSKGTTIYLHATGDQVAFGPGVYSCIKYGEKKREFSSFAFKFTSPKCLEVEFGGSADKFKLCKTGDLAPEHPPGTSVPL